MNRKWGFFAGAAILTAAILMAFGAPPAAVAGGTVLAALLSLRRSPVL
jgi:hypothetical protein